MWRTGSAHDDALLSANQQNEDSIFEKVFKRKNIYLKFTTKG
jgi:hypothetical protein